MKEFFCILLPNAVCLKMVAPFALTYLEKTSRGGAKTRSF